MSYTTIICPLWFLSYDLVMIPLKTANTRRNMFGQPQWRCNVLTNLGNCWKNRRVKLLKFIFISMFLLVAIILLSLGHNLQLNFFFLLLRVTWICSYDCVNCGRLFIYAELLWGNNFSYGDTYKEMYTIVFFRVTRIILIVDLCCWNQPWYWLYYRHSCHKWWEYHLPYITQNSFF
jgi:hypothetical protein